MFPTEKQFIDLMKAKRIKLSTKVVLYDTKLGQPSWATRSYYIFSMMGHPNVSVLNGGLIQWIAEGRLTESDKDLATWEQDFKYTLNAKRFTSYEQIL